ncbi:TspO/MBR family protein [Legionella yabuuchiae]|uniref:TspO/MBR family protein n=1 Tax=Legionella yabuuchiae TaxID=376727 RepID=UPI001054C8CD|nr:TspO/MBR family protein [Legionella yabuuchiae]
MRLKHWIKLIFWIALFQLIGFLLGILTQANLHPWYESLHKSSLTPPGVVFSIAWAVLYILLALIAWILSNQDKESFKPVKYLFALQMLMNWTWTMLFFQFHWLAFSAAWLIVLTFINCILMVNGMNKHKIVGLLLIPYVLWLMFASYLNLFIALTN